MTPTGGTVAGSERLVVPVGENRVLRLGGAARGPVDIATASGEAKIVRASVDPNTSEVMLSGAGLGRETITLTREGATTSVNVAVQAFAGLIDPTPRTVTVTGQRPLPGERLSGLVAQVAAQSARPHPGATVRLAAPSRLGAVPARPGRRRPSAFQSRWRGRT
jgi:hypothetical protein